MRIRTQAAITYASVLLAVAALMLFGRTPTVAAVDDTAHVVLPTAGAYMWEDGTPTAILPSAPTAEPVSECEWQVLVQLDVATEGVYGENFDSQERIMRDACKFWGPDARVYISPEDSSWRVTAVSGEYAGRYWQGCLHRDAPCAD